MFALSHPPPLQTYVLLSFIFISLIAKPSTEIYNKYKSVGAILNGRTATFPKGVYI